MATNTWADQFMTELGKRGIPAYAGSTGGGCNAVFIDVFDIEITDGDSQLPDGDVLYVQRYDYDDGTPEWEQLFDSKVLTPAEGATVVADLLAVVMS